MSKCPITVESWCGCVFCRGWVPLKGLCYRNKSVTCVENFRCKWRTIMPTVKNYVLIYYFVLFFYCTYLKKDMMS